jgi:mono/diheme cytochrome c family protein
MRKLLFLLIAGSMILASVALVVAADAAHGKEVYAAQKCQMCHSIAGVGNKKFPLDGVATKLKGDKVKIQGWITNPKGQDPKTTMPAKATIPANDLADLVEYLLTLK